MDPNDAAQMDAIVAALVARNQVVIQNPVNAVGLGGAHKLEKLKSTAPADWTAWRESFEQAKVINQWNDVRARRELRANMSGKASENVRHIECEINPADDDHAAEWAAPVEDMLDAYGRVFKPAAAIQMAESEFRRAKQGEHETLVDWHGRLRSIYREANPGITNAAMNTARPLIGKFIVDLSNLQVVADVHKDNPQTYAEAYDRAIASMSQILTLKEQLARRQKESIGAVGGACFSCGSIQHVARDCPIAGNKSSGLAKMEKKERSYGNRKPQEGQGRKKSQQLRNKYQGNKKGASGSRGGKKPQHRNINAMQVESGSGSEN